MKNSGKKIWNSHIDCFAGKGGEATTPVSVFLILHESGINTKSETLLNMRTPAQPVGVRVFRRLCRDPHILLDADAKLDLYLTAIAEADCELDLLYSAEIKYRRSLVLRLVQVQGTAFG